jgi:6-phosphogluconate dehydrogenase (decarboxylating)
MTHVELFFLVDAGEGRWTIKHAITEELAGSLMRTTKGLVLRDSDARFIGNFPTTEVALRNLYALV